MLGNILKYIRICNDFTTKEVALSMKTSSAYISEIESGRRKISTNALAKFSNYYNIDPRQVLYWYKLEGIGKNRKEILKEILEYYIEKEKTKIN